MNQSNVIASLKKKSFNLEDELTMNDNDYEQDTEDDMPRLQKYSLHTQEDTDKWKQINQTQKQNRKVSFQNKPSSIKQITPKNSQQQQHIKKQSKISLKYYQDLLNENSGQEQHQSSINTIKKNNYLDSSFTPIKNTSNQNNDQESTQIKGIQKNRSVSSISNSQQQQQNNKQFKQNTFSQYLVADKKQKSSENLLSSQPTNQNLQASSSLSILNQYPTLNPKNGIQLQQQQNNNISNFGAGDHSPQSGMLSHRSINKQNSQSSDLSYNASLKAISTKNLLQALKEEQKIYGDKNDYEQMQNKQAVDKYLAEIGYKREYIEIEDVQDVVIERDLLNLEKSMQDTIQIIKEKEKYLKNSNLIQQQGEVKELREEHIQYEKKKLLQCKKISILYQDKLNLRKHIDNQEVVIEQMCETVINLYQKLQQEINKLKNYNNLLPSQKEMHQENRIKTLEDELQEIKEEKKQLEEQLQNNTQELQNLFIDAQEAKKVIMEQLQEIKARKEQLDVLQQQLNNQQDNNNNLNNFTNNNLENQMKNIPLFSNQQSELMSTSSPKIQRHKMLYQNSTKMLDNNNINNNGNANNGFSQTLNFDRKQIQNQQNSNNSFIINNSNTEDKLNKSGTIQQSKSNQVLKTHKIQEQTRKSLIQTIQQQQFTGFSSVEQEDEDDSQQEINLKDIDVDSNKIQQQNNENNDNNLQQIEQNLQKQGNQGNYMQKYYQDKLLQYAQKNDDIQNNYKRLSTLSQISQQNKNNFQKKQQYTNNNNDPQNYNQNNIVLSLQEQINSQLQSQQQQQLNQQQIQSQFQKQNIIDMSEQSDDISEDQSEQESEFQSLESQQQMQQQSSQQSDLSIQQNTTPRQQYTPTQPVQQQNQNPYQHPIKSHNRNMSYSPISYNQQQKQLYGQQIQKGKHMHKQSMVEPNYNQSICKIKNMINNLKQEQENLRKDDIFQSQDNNNDNNLKSDNIKVLKQQQSYNNIINNKKNNNDSSPEIKMIRTKQSRSKTNVNVNQFSQYF